MKPSLKFMESNQKTLGKGDLMSEFSEMVERHNKEMAALLETTFTEKQRNDMLQRHAQESRKVHERRLQTIPFGLFPSDTNDV